MRKMPDKSDYVEFEGNSLSQDLKGSNFVEDYNTWRENCQSISGGRMGVKSIPTLYDFLKSHMDGNIRAKSRNDGLDGTGAIQFMTLIEDIIDDPDKIFTNEEAKLIESLSSTLAAMEGEGEKAGETGPARDPAFILFTETELDSAGNKKFDRKVQGHYATEWYAKRNEGTSAVDGTWLTGNNPPHQALFSETSTEFAKPKGLVHIMKEAAGAIGGSDLDVLIDTIPSGTDAADIDEISGIERFFDKVATTQTYWSAGGKLLVNKVRKELQSTSFKIGNADREIVSELANLKINTPKGAAGQLNSFTLSSTATPIISLVDRALKRKDKITAPNGYRAWQNSTKRGFDYRKTARERFGEDTGKYSPDAKTIGKMWQAHLWG